MFEKVLIANRGEIAVRIIRSLRDMGITSVAVYAVNEKNALHVALADEAVCIGPEPLSESYLKVPNILSAAEITGADAVHPGYGLLAENPDFAEACIQSGFVFIGPQPEIIASLGDKIKARHVAKKVGVPVVPGSEGPVKDEREVRNIADELGYPLILKAAHGGGGRGMKLVTSPGSLSSAFQLAQVEAEAAFGSGEIFVEKYFEPARHIEVQVFGDGKGGVICLGDRDCSVQRRNQKIVEEAPAPFLSWEVRKRIWNDAVKLAAHLKYLNAGTVEFLVDEEGNHYFLEMNTRIQVEHPVTEIITGTDIVKAQVLIAANEDPGISSLDEPPNVHALECRINAEDPYSFAPSPGVVEDFHFPGGPYVRVDTALLRNQMVSPVYDPLLAKVITWGENREQAIERMKRALAETRVSGVKINVPFLLKLLEFQDFVRGPLSTRMVEKVLVS